MVDHVTNRSTSAVMTHALRLWILNVQNKQITMKQKENSVFCSKHPKVETTETTTYASSI
jgi:hypothetical protein